MLTSQWTDYIFSLDFQPLDFWVHPDTIYLTENAIWMPGLEKILVFVSLVHASAMNGGASWLLDTP